MTSSETRSAAAAFVRSVRGLLDLSVTAEDFEAVERDISSFLGQPGAGLLSDAQRRNLVRMKSTASRRAAAARRGNR